MTLHNETTAAAEVQRPAYVLSDDELDVYKRQSMY